MKRVVITGIGIVSPNGNSVNEVWENISNLKCGLIESEYPSANHIGVVDDSFNETLNSKEKRYMDRCTQLALVSSREAIKDANVSITDDNSEDISISVGSSIGGINALSDELGAAAVSGVNKMTVLAIPKSLISMIPANLSIDLGIKGDTLAYSNACASATIAIGEAFRKIQHGESPMILAGGTEACAIPQVLEPFRKLKALSKGEQLNKACIPFAKERSGFVLSEGAAMLMLEEYEHAVNRGAKIYCEVFGYGSSSDAKSLLAPDIEGVKRCMNNALKDARMNGEEIEYINAHGTSTPLNDITEARAIESLFPNHPLVSSTKSLHGHALGAAGAIELALSCLMIEHQELIPTINVTESDLDPEMNLNFLLNHKGTYQGGKILSNSFAFGGHNASMIIGQVAG